MTLPVDPFRIVAKTGKAHGLDGTLRLFPLSGNRAGSWLNSGTLLYLENRRGERMPVRIVDLRIEEKRNSRLFFVKFDRISNRSDAEQYQECTVFIDRSDYPEPEEESAEGFEVFDESGLAGVIEEVIEHPGQTLLRVRQKGHGPEKEFLVPWVEEYVLSVDHERRRLNCRNLKHLKEL